jgi:hypothetical protein
MNSRIPAGWRNTTPPSQRKSTLPQYSFARPSDCATCDDAHGVVLHCGQKRKQSFRKLLRYAREHADCAAILTTGLAFNISNRERRPYDTRIPTSLIAAPAEKV